MIGISLRVNEEDISANVAPETLLVDFLREHLHLTGTHVGCETTQCGACTVHLDGSAIKSCATLAVQANGGTVTTVEGLAAIGEPLHPMQEAFRTHHGLQCGFCTPGMVMAAIDMVRRLGVPDEATIREQLKGNVCRCTGYQNVVRAIEAGALVMAGGQTQPLDFQEVAT